MSSPSEILISQLLRQHLALYLVKVHFDPHTMWLRVWWRPLDAGMTRNISHDVAIVTGLFYDVDRDAVKIPSAMVMDTNIPRFLVRAIANHVMPGQTIPYEML
jgi:hypothetical protein